MLKLDVKKCNLVERTAAFKYELFGTTQREGLTNLQTGDPTFYDIVRISIFVRPSVWRITVGYIDRFLIVPHPQYFKDASVNLCIVLMNIYMIC